MRFDLAQMVARAGRARKSGLDLNVIRPTKAAEDDLARIYVRILRAVAEFARDRLMLSYRASLAQRTARDGFRDDVSDLERDLGGLGEELQRLILTLIPEMRDWTVRVEKWGRQRWVQSVLTATGISLETMVGPEDHRETMEASLARQVDLIRGLAEDARAKTADAIWRGFQTRAPARDTAKAIDEVMRVGRKRALRIASHQTQVLASTLDQERQQNAGITEFKWRHGGSAHPRPEHVARNGRIYKWSALPADGPPGTLPNCKCKAQAWLTFE